MTLTIFICASEITNAGERDYMLALSKSMGAKSMGSKSMGAATQTHNPAIAFKINGIQSQTLTPPPHNKFEYELLPEISHPALYQAVINSNQCHIRIVGVGNATLTALQQAAQYVKSRFIDHQVSTAYITHKINNANDLISLSNNNTLVFSPLDREILSGLDAHHAEMLSMHYIPAVPHTNTNIAAAHEFQSLMSLHREQKSLLPKIIDEKLPFVFAVLNAGYKKDGTTHTPYTADEAYHDGAMLASRLPLATHLILADGGPRNGFDIAQGHNTRARFTQGFADAMQIMGYYSPLLVTLPYDAHPHSPNSVKAGLHMGKMSNCMAFVSNAEGFGTMDSAIRHINPGKRPIYAFPFAAQDDDPTHQQNIEHYHALGISLLNSRTGQSRLTRTKTPAPSINSAQEIIRALGLTPAFTPQTPALSPTSLTRPRPIPRNTYSS